MKYLYYNKDMLDSFCDKAKVTKVELRVAKRETKGWPIYTIYAKESFSWCRIERVLFIHVGAGEQFDVEIVSDKLYEEDGSDGEVIYSAYPGDFHFFAQFTSVDDARRFVLEVDVSEGDEIAAILHGEGDGSLICLGVSGIAVRSGKGKGLAYGISTGSSAIRLP